MPFIEYFKIAAILGTALLNLFLGNIVLAQNKKNKINLVFFLLALSYSLWGFSLLFYEYSFMLPSRFWIMATYFLVPIFEVLTLAFSFVFPIEMFKKAKKIAYVYSVLYLIFSYWLLFFTDKWVVDVVIDPIRGLQTITGPGYGWWVIATWGALGWAIINFFIKSRLLTGRHKAQLWYLFLGFILWGIIVNIPDVILPIFFNQSRYFAISTLVSLTFTLSVTYAILKHRLLDVRLVVARSVAYLLLIIVLGTVYAGGLFLASAYVFKQPAPVASLGISTALALVIAFSFQPILIFIEKITNRIFYKEKYDENELLYELTRVMASKLRLADLTGGLLEKILGAMHLSRGAFILIDKGKISHLNRQGYPSEPQFVPQFSEDELKKLADLTGMTIFDELAETPLKELLRKLEISLAVPLRTKTETEDILILGEKLSGEPYTDQDISLLEIFASQAAIAVENASTVEKILALDEAKSEFITVVSHHLRTPLSVARWDFELLLEEAFGKIPVKARKIVENIYNSLMVLNHGLNNMMMAIEIEEEKATLNLEETDFKKEVLENVLESLVGKIKKRKIAIKLEVKTPKLLKVDKRKLRSVMEILIDNAIEYSPLNSTVTITAKFQDGLLISVADEGMGVNFEDKKMITKKFYRGEHAKKIQPNGFGLGLFIAKAFVSLHGGSLQFEDKSPSGTIFYFTIPADGDIIKKGKEASE